MRVLQNFINGEYVPASGSEQFNVIDPVTEEVIAISPVSVAADVDRAYEAARLAFEGE